MPSTPPLGALRRKKRGPTISPVAASDGQSNRFLQEILGDPLRRRLDEPIRPRSRIAGAPCRHRSKRNGNFNNRACGRKRLGRLQIRTPFVVARNDRGVGGILGVALVGERRGHGGDADLAVAAVEGGGVALNDWKTGE